MFLLAQMSAPTAGPLIPSDKLSAVLNTAIVGTLLLVTVVSTLVALVWSSIRVKQIEADLKHDMLDRGMTADEIQQVIEATPRSGFGSLLSSWHKEE
jgi:hypothetical protein